MQVVYDGSTKQSTPKHTYKTWERARNVALKVLGPEGKHRVAILSTPDGRFFPALLNDKKAEPEPIEVPYRPRGPREAKMEPTALEQPPKRGRGRPRKHPLPN